MEKDNQTIPRGHVLKKRLENVATALYLVTNHLSDKEPIKSRSREAINIVLEECIVLSDISDQTISTRLDHVRSMLRIASLSGIVSKQNVSLIENEIIAIQSVINEYRNMSSNLSIHINDILTLGEADIQIANPHIMGNNPVSAPASMVSVYASHQPVTTEVRQVIQPASQIAPQTQVQKNWPLSQEVKPKTQTVDSPKKQGMTDRQVVILKEIKSKGQLTIRDLIGKIEGCSEKTIQRELLSMVEAGVLKKEGERRWSRYSAN